ncbi:hypothetical protein OKW50_002297 [Paraburkholderia youngii]
MVCCFEPAWCPRPEDLYYLVWVTIELIAAALAYMAIMKLWRRYRTK